MLRTGGWLLAFCLSALAAEPTHFTVGLPGFPKALLHYAGNDEPSDAIDFYVFEPLFRMSPRDRRPVPVLAERWKVSADHRHYTFTLNPRARFSDGTPVTADDVKFTWEAIHDPRNPFPPAKAFFGSFQACETRGTREIVFTAQSAHFKNFEKLSELLILPRHASAGIAAPYPAQLIGSGPYVLAETKLGEQITLRRNTRYWGATSAHFDELIFKAVADPQTQLELFRQGTLDAVYFWVAKLWATQTEDAFFHSGKVKKLVVKTRLPFGTSGIAWNLRRPLFQDVRVRQALAHLLDRPRFLHELFYDAYRLSTGVVSPESPAHDPANRPLAFDPARARTLLREAGWRTPGSDGVLVKDGQRFSFEILAKEAAAERFLTLYQETLRKQGIEMRIRIADWTTALRRVDARDFDGYLSYRGRDAEPSDFALSWGSENAAIAGSDNLTGFADARVDQWAKALDQSFDPSVRQRLARQIDRAIAEQAPMAFTWEPEALRIAYWDRFIVDNRPPPYARWYQLFADWRPAAEPQKARR